MGQRTRAGSSGRTPGATVWVRTAARARRVHAWLIPIVLVGVATLIQDQIAAVPDRVGGWLSSQDAPATGPDFSVSVDLIRLDDEGLSAVTPEDFRPDAAQAALLARQDIAASPRFTALLRSAGAVNLGTRSLRLTLTGRRDDQVNILDIQPEFVRRTAPLSGTLFDVPSQGGSEAFTMMLDLDRPNPVAHEAVSDGDTYGLRPGPPFFARRTITLKKKEQSVVILRATTQHNYAVFRLRLTYMVGDRRKQTVVDDHGQPFRVTAPASSDGRSGYRRVFGLQPDFSLCQTTPAVTDTAHPCERR
ncbi:hypothetical protein ABZ848_04885 [Streptomyces sp. NPDC047081]|uniref:hypothetical protein n=1 Tax=Streptomyces sp. NPDC047081 TaxID=3154706 RepID=UPI0033DBDFD3